MGGSFKEFYRYRRTLPRKLHRFPRNDQFQTALEVLRDESASECFSKVRSLRRLQPTKFSNVREIETHQRNIYNVTRFIPARRTLSAVISSKASIFSTLGDYREDSQSRNKIIVEILAARIRNLYMESLEKLLVRLEPLF